MEDRLPFLPTLYIVLAVTTVLWLVLAFLLGRRILTCWQAFGGMAGPHPSVEEGAGLGGLAPGDCSRRALLDRLLPRSLHVLRGSCGRPARYCALKGV